MLRQFRLTTLVALFVVIPAVAAAAAPFAYIPNSVSSDVSVIDLGATPTTVTSFSLPGTIMPWGVALNPAGTRLYVTNAGNGSIQVVDTTTTPPSIVKTILTRRQPLAVAVNAAGTRVYVSHMRVNSTGQAGGVTVIDAATNEIVSAVTVGLLNQGIVVHPDGSRVYLASTSSSAVLVLDAAALESGTAGILETIAVGSLPFGLVMNASGSRLYVTNKGINTVSAINTADNSVAVGFVGSNPIGVALSPDETRVYVTNNVGGSLSVLNAATLQPVTTDIPLGGAPYGVDVASDGRIIVANSVSGANNVWVIDPVTFAVTSLAVGASPVAFGRFIHRAAFVETMLQLSVSPGSVVIGSSGPITLTATLTRKDTGAPVSGGSVTFMVDGLPVGSGMTGGIGSASLAYDPSDLAVGAHDVRGVFAESMVGGVTHKASQASGSLSIAYGFDWRMAGGTANAGSTVPVRFSLTDANGNPITDSSPVITSAEVACQASAASGLKGAKVRANAAGQSGLRFDASTGLYLFNWRTEKSWAGTCRSLIVDTQDGASHSLQFQFR